MKILYVLQQMPDLGTYVRAVKLLNKPMNSKREAAPQRKMSWEQQILTAQAVPYLTGRSPAGPKQDWTGASNPSTVPDKVRGLVGAGVHPDSLLQNRRSQDWAQGHPQLSSGQVRVPQPDRPEPKQRS